MQMTFEFMDREWRGVSRLMRFTASGKFNDKVTLAGWLAFYNGLGNGGGQ